MGPRRTFGAVTTSNDGRPMPAEGPATDRQIATTVTTDATAVTTTAGAPIITNERDAKARQLEAKM